MKVSLNSMLGLCKRYGCIDDLVSGNVDELVEKIGSQLGAIEEVIDIGKKYQGIIVAKVVECKKLEGSDHLSVCKIDDGGKAQNTERDDGGHVQVVCGAPNVREDLTVAWLPPGATVPATADKDPLVLEAREIRGVKSNGMLTSAKELEISDNHEGLLEIDEDVAPGTDFAEKFGLAGDHVIDIENKMFTHRPDCFGFLGVAREIVGIQQKPFKSPDWYTPNPDFPRVDGEELKLEVANEIPDLAPRFTAIAMSGITVKPSPIWLQIELTKVGMKPINNIVDLTNYFMLETGQPLHAYDYDKVKALSGGDGAKIVVRQPKSGEKIKLLNGKEVEPRAEAIMIATDKQLIGIGGVMGGSETEVDENTKNIIIECASFDMYSIRRTSMEHGLFTDAVARFNKGQSPLQNLAVLAKIVDDIQNLAGGKVASAVIDNNQVKDREWVHPPVKVSTDFVNARLGLKLSAGEMKQLLENVEFNIDTNGNELAVTAPFWRTDIELREDVVEEIGRLYGYDKLPLDLPARTVKPAEKDKLLELKSRIRAILSRAGANEVLTYSFVDADLMKKVGQDPGSAFQIANAISPDLQYYRLSLTPSLLEKVNPNLKAGYDEFAIFELGKAHIVNEKDSESLPREDDLTALIVAASSKLKKSDAPYYTAKKYLTGLVPVKLTFKPVSAEMQKFDITKPYDMNRTSTIYAGDKFIGLIGEFRQSVARNLKLPKFCAGFELDSLAVEDIINHASTYTPLPRYPKVTQDITLQVPSDLKFQEVSDFITAKLDELKPKETLLNLEPVGIYQKADDKGHKNLTYHLTIASYERTLTDAEVTKLLDEVAAAAKEKLGADRV